MNKIIEQFNCGKFTVISLQSPPPPNWKKGVRIDNCEYDTEIVYDLPGSIGIIGNGNFKGKPIEFLD